MSLVDIDKHLLVFASIKKLIISTLQGTLEICGIMVIVRCIVHQLTSFQGQMLLVVTFTYITHGQTIYTNTLALLNLGGGICLHLNLKQSHLSIYLASSKVCVSTQIT